MPRPPNPANSTRPGLWLDRLGVAIFAPTLPVTENWRVQIVAFAGCKMPVSTDRQPSLDPEGTAP